MIQEQITTLTLPYPLGDKRVRVYVPAHEEGETFPVVYMTDGQNLFEDTDLRFGCWYTREAVTEERRLSGQAAIIVGCPDWSPTQGQASSASVSISARTVAAVKSGMSTGVKSTRSHLSRR